MSKKPVLVVMAAGMGSRYGGLKQIDPVRNHGEAILDFSLYDAYHAGFETAVIIIKEAIRDEFMETVGKRLEKCPLEIRYAYQELTALPEGYTLPEGRVKPWGTSHAILCARDAIGDAPFVAINADDYYGKSAYQTIFKALTASETPMPNQFYMVAYELGKTVTAHGGVTRGVCITEKDYLSSITERTGIESYDGGIHFPLNEETWIDLPADTTVSMNFWGFTPKFMEMLEAQFPKFLDQILQENPMKGEFLLPTTVQALLKEHAIQVQVLRSKDQWYGVTYSADKPIVVAAIQNLTAEGHYPNNLW